MDLVSPRVRLPLVELKSETRAEIDAVLARVCEQYPGYLIGKLARRDQTTTQPVNHGRPRTEVCGRVLTGRTAAFVARCVRERRTLAQSFEICAANKAASVRR